MNLKNERMIEMMRTTMINTHNGKKISDIDKELYIRYNLTDTWDTMELYDSGLIQYEYELMDYIALVSEAKYFNPKAIEEVHNLLSDDVIKEVFEYMYEYINNSDYHIRMENELSLLHYAVVKNNYTVDVEYIKKYVKCIIEWLIAIYVRKNVKPSINSRRIAHGIANGYYTFNLPEVNLSPDGPVVTFFGVRG